jgi:DNA-directed RNA polymerase specialized sigma24 family protein
MTHESDPEFAQHLVREERALPRYVLELVRCVEEARDMVQETVALLWARRAEHD